MFRVEREQTRIVDRGGLNFEIEVLAKLLANRETKRAIEANSKRRVDDDLRSAEAIKEAFDHEVVLVGHRAECRDAAPDEDATLIDRISL